MKSLPIIGGTTNERLLIPKSNSTIWTPAQSAGNVFFLSFGLDHVDVSYIIVKHMYLLTINSIDL